MNYPTDCIESLNAWIDELNATWDATHPFWGRDFEEELKEREVSPLSLQIRAEIEAPSINPHLGTPQATLPLLLLPSSQTKHSENDSTTLA
jgi:hypothetical protein